MKLELQSAATATACLCIGAATFSWTTSPQEPKKLTLNELEIVGLDGKGSRILLWVDKYGAHIQLQADEKNEIQLDATLPETAEPKDEESTTNITLSGAAGMTGINEGRLALSAPTHPVWFLGGMAEHPTAIMFNKEGTSTMLFGSQPNGEPQILLGGKAGALLTLVPTAKK